MLIWTTSAEKPGTRMFRVPLRMYLTTPWLQMYSTRNKGFTLDDLCNNSQPSQWGIQCTSKGNATKHYTLLRNSMVCVECWIGLWVATLRQLIWPSWIRKMGIELRAACGVRKSWLGMSGLEVRVPGGLLWRHPWPRSRTLNATLTIQMDKQWHSKHSRVAR